MGKRIVLPTHKLRLGAFSAVIVVAGIVGLVVDTNLSTVHGNGSGVSRGRTTLVRTPLGLTTVSSMVGPVPTSVIAALNEHAQIFTLAPANSTYAYPEASAISTAVADAPWPGPVTGASLVLSADISASGAPS
jgi:hypothetical protein